MTNDDERDTDEEAANRDAIRNPDPDTAADPAADSTPLDELLGSVDKLKDLPDEVDEDLAPPTYDDTLRFWAAMFMSVAEDSATALEQLDAVVEPAHRQAIAAVWNAVGATAMRGATTVAAWLDGVPADAPELVAAAEDPGDLTCPRCDGPIPLAQLRALGICETCDRAEMVGIADPSAPDDESAVV